MKLLCGCRVMMHEGSFEVVSKVLGWRILGEGLLKMVSQSLSFLML